VGDHPHMAGTVADLLRNRCSNLRVT
jgi:hypothetical protein